MALDLEAGFAKSAARKMKKSLQAFLAWISVTLGCSASAVFASAVSSGFWVALVRARAALVLVRLRHRSSPRLLSSAPELSHSRLADRQEVTAS